MDALSLLRADHESVLGLFEVLDGAPKGTGAAESGLDTMVTNGVGPLGRESARSAEPLSTAKKAGSWAGPAFSCLNQLVATRCSWVNGLALSTLGLPPGLRCSPWFCRASLPSHCSAGFCTYCHFMPSGHGP